MKKYILCLQHRGLNSIESTHIGKTWEHCIGNFIKKHFGKTVEFRYNHSLNYFRENDWGLYGDLVQKYRGKSQVEIIYSAAYLYGRAIK